MMDHSRGRWFRSVNGDGAYGLVLLLIVLLFALLSLGGEALRLRLQYERSALAAGEFWRLVTGHAVHLGARHTAFNIAGLVLLWALFARHFRPRDWLIIALAGIAVIDVGLWMFQPEISWYVGLSGLLHAVWAAGAMADWRRADWRSWLPLVLLVAKLIYEQWSGASALLAGMPVVVNAHLYGAIGGALAAATLLLLKARQHQSL